MTTITKETTVKSLSGTSLDEEQRVQEMNSSIKSNVDQNEMEPSLKTIDVKHLSVEGTKKSIVVKTKNLISKCIGTLDQEPMSHSPG